MSPTLKRRIDACIAKILKGTIFLRPDGQRLPGGSFTARIGKLRTRNGPWVTWWKTKYREQGEQSLALLILEHRKLNGVTVETCIEHVNEVLREQCSDEIFELEDMLHQRKTCLFECLKIGFSSFVEKYYTIVEARSSEGVLVRLTVVPIMPRLRGISFEISELGLGLLDRNDSEEINRKRIPRFGEYRWDSKIGAFEDTKILFKREAFSYLAYSVDRGTREYCLEQSYIKLRAFTAILTAYLTCVGRFDCYQTVIAEPSREWVQFSEVESGEAWRASASDPLIPYFAHEALIDQLCVDDLSVWYGNLLSMSSEQIMRVDKCANYINLGNCARGMVKFLFGYIALDALFGKRWSVERSISEGIRIFAPESHEKAKPLFELRNEIMHGGSRRIEEWNGYRGYFSRFRSTPDRDIHEISLRCLYGYPRAPI